MLPEIENFSHQQDHNHYLQIYDAMIKEHVHHRW